MSARRLQPTYVQKPWGRTDGLPGPAESMPLGEIVFADAAPSLIIKWLQTAEALSVQVHPDGKNGGPRKHEWWHVTDSRPGGHLYLGLREAATWDAVASAARDGRILDLLDRIEPRIGDSFFVPAGTIHALGPGLTVLEVQEPCDITYRLYDYGRDRPLDLEQGLGCASLSPQAKSGPDAPFKVDHLRLAPGQPFTAELADGYLIVLDGNGAINAEQFAALESWRISGNVTLCSEQGAHLMLARSSLPTNE